MPTGLEVIHPNGINQLGSSGGALFVLASKGVMTVSENSQYQLPRSQAGELLFLSAPGGVSVCRGVGVAGGNSHTIKILGAGTNSLKWYTFKRASDLINLSLDGFGLQVFLENGDISYHSSMKIARFINFAKVPDNSLAEVESVFNPEKNAVLLTSSRYRVIPSGSVIGMGVLHMDCLQFRAGRVAVGLLGVGLVPMPNFQDPTLAMKGGHLLSIDVSNY